MGACNCGQHISAMLCNCKNSGNVRQNIKGGYNMEFNKQELHDIYDTINSYMDSVSAWDFDSEDEYCEKMDRLNELLGKIWEVIK